MGGQSGQHKRAKYLALSQLLFLIILVVNVSADQSEGCAQLNQDGTCRKCKSGYWGESCENTCSSNCRVYNWVCARDTGKCIYCKQSGRWGLTCENTCPFGCTTNYGCKRDSGECHYCKSGFSPRPWCPIVIQDPEEVEGHYGKKSKEYEKWVKLTPDDSPLADSIPFWQAASKVTKDFDSVCFLAASLVVTGFRMEKWSKLSDHIYAHNSALFREMQEARTLLDPFTRERYSSDVPWSLRMVHYEQSVVQTFISSWSDYETSGVSQLIWYGSAFDEPTKWATEKLGSKINFPNQQHRETIGTAIVFQNLGRSKEEFLDFQGDGEE